MTAIKVHAVIESDGELHLRDLPYRKGDQVEAVLLVEDRDNEARREAARKQFLEHTKKSQFRSMGPYPSRDELHERR